MVAEEERQMPQRQGVVNVIGGGLAGAEAAWQAAQRGHRVVLWEMRPQRLTPAHTTGKLAEMVCSNSFGSDLPDRASGLLKAEMRRLGSLLLACADQARVPAGSALAVGRERFAELVTERIVSHPSITVRQEEALAIPDGVTIIATGPLTSPAFADAIMRAVGTDYLYFYDALAPIVNRESINMEIAFVASRYERDQDGDYINCPLSESQYEKFVNALVSGECIELREFEQEDPRFFEACLPIEVLARRGQDALVYGPLRPVGIRDPRTGKRPYAVVQLRQDDIAGTLCNLVGFQTNLRWAEQERIFRSIPGLEDAEFVRFGQMHRNTFLNSPLLLESTMQYRGREDLFLAGQLTGVEGYVGSIGTGLLAGINASHRLTGNAVWTLPKETMLGSLANYVSQADPAHFQPMKANYGLLPPLEQPVHSKRERCRLYSERALRRLDQFLEERSYMSARVVK